MIPKHFKYISIVVFINIVISGCSTFSFLDEIVPDNSQKYRKAETMPPLEVPPDLSTDQINDDIVGNQNSTVSYSEFEEEANNPLAKKYNIAPEAKPALSGEGGQRHLIVLDHSGVLWQRLQDFWLQKGYKIRRQDPRIGLMDTNEGTDHYSFRLRMERSDLPKHVDIFISGHGQKNNIDKNEAMLRQMATFFGVLYQKDKQEYEVVKATQLKPLSVKTVLSNETNDHLALIVEQNFSEVWKRVGRVLDSKGFFVENRDRALGTYFVRYIDPFNTVEKKEESWVKKLFFWKDKVDQAPEEFYFIKLISDADKTKIVIMDTEKVRISTDTAKRLLVLIKEQLS